MEQRQKEAIATLLDEYQKSLVEKSMVAKELARLDLTFKPDDLLHASEPFLLVARSLCKSYIKEFELGTDYENSFVQELHALIKQYCGVDIMPEFSYGFTPSKKKSSKDEK